MLSMVSEICPGCWNPLQICRYHRATEEQRCVVEREDAGTVMEGPQGSDV